MSGTPIIHGLTPGGIAQVKTIMKDINEGRLTGSAILEAIQKLNLPAEEENRGSVQDLNTAAAAELQKEGYVIDWSMPLTESVRQGAMPQKGGNAVVSKPIAKPVSTAPVSATLPLATQQLPSSFVKTSEDRQASPAQPAQPQLSAADRQLNEPVTYIPEPQKQAQNVVTSVDNAANVKWAESNLAQFQQTLANIKKQVGTNPVTYFTFANNRKNIADQLSALKKASDDFYSEAFKKFRPAIPSVFIPETLNNLEKEIRDMQAQINDAERIAPQSNVTKETTQWTTQFDTFIKKANNMLATYKKLESGQLTIDANNLAGISKKFDDFKQSYQVFFYGVPKEIRATSAFSNKADEYDAITKEIERIIKQLQKVQAGGPNQQSITTTQPQVATPTELTPHHNNQQWLSRLQKKMNEIEKQVGGNREAYFADEQNRTTISTQLTALDKEVSDLVRQ